MAVGVCAKGLGFGDGWVDRHFEVVRFTARLRINMRGSLNYHLVAVWFDALSSFESWNEITNLNCLNLIGFYGTQ